MRFVTCGLLLSAALFALPAAACAADTAPDLSFTVKAPAFPTPLQASILGLALTAVAAIGARASGRSADTMMYSVLATVALTGVFVSYSDRLHSEFVRAGLQKLEQLQQEAQARAAT